MTHDELISLLTTMTNDDAIFMKDALRAVVELHKPVEDKWMSSGFACDGCKNRCGCYEGDMGAENDWTTCPTIQAIEKELA
jgi:hypothetical protein